MSGKPEIKTDPMYMLIREGEIAEFNKRKAQGNPVDLTACDFRGLDLRGLNATGIDFSNSYFRWADLRGIDFSSSQLEGASINGAKVSGCYFPKQISAVEIDLSITHGTRLRHGN